MSLDACASAGEVSQTMAASAVIGDAALRGALGLCEPAFRRDGCTRRRALALQALSDGGNKILTVKRLSEQPKFNTCMGRL